MKKLIATFFVVLLCGTMLAQNPEGGRHKRHGRPAPPQDRGNGKQPFGHAEKET